MLTSSVTLLALWLAVRHNASHVLRTRVGGRALWKLKGTMLIMANCLAQSSFNKRQLQSFFARKLSKGQLGSLTVWQEENWDSKKEGRRLQIRAREDAKDWSARNQTFNQCQWIRSQTSSRRCARRSEIGSRSFRGSTWYEKKRWRAGWHGDGSHEFTSSSTKRVSWCIAYGYDNRPTRMWRKFRCWCRSASTLGQYFRKTTLNGESGRSTVRRDKCNKPDAGMGDYRSTDKREDHSDKVGRRQQGGRKEREVSFPPGSKRN